MFSIWELARGKLQTGSDPATNVLSQRTGDPLISPQIPSEHSCDASQRCSDTAMMEQTDGPEAMKVDLSPKSLNL